MKRMMNKKPIPPSRWEGDPLTDPHGSKLHTGDKNLQMIQKNPESFSYH